MLKLLKWLDDNILTIFAGFLLAFIPLYPKLPLFDVLPGYIVRVRLEDFFVALTVIIWVIWTVRRKVNLTDNPLFKPIAGYLTVGLISMISAVLIIQSVPLELIHVQKLILHYLRRIEYFSLFFIFYSSVKTFKTLKIYLWILIATIILVAIYGFGQKYFYWPAFSTMNREFSKGWVLYLTKHARVLSTFGGHYDLAAYIMMVLVLLWSLFFAVRSWFVKIFLFLIIAASFWTLILTASRTSFIAYIMGLTAMFLLWTYRKGINWSVSRWLTVVLMSIIVMLSFGDLSERFTKLLKIDDRFSGIRSLLYSPIGKPPSDKALFLENNPNAILARITSKSDQPPTLGRPSDVYENIPLNPGSPEASLAAVPRTYSKTAFTYDLSTAIRFDALWPMAIKGFKRNPIFGSGYATLNKLNPTDFTEAESTDNDYLRSLGETGILGFATFYGTLIFIIYYIWRNIAVLEDPILFSVSIGLAGLTVGLLVNAVYIDVFESSKVAFSFWAMTGFILAGVKISRDKLTGKIPFPVMKNFNEFSKKIRSNFMDFLRSDLLLILFLIIIALTVRLYKINTPLADWHSWRQADTSSVTRNYVRHGINLLYPTYDDLSNVASGKDNPKGLRFVEFPLYNMYSVIIDKLFPGYNVEFSGRLASILASIGSMIFLFLITRKYLDRKTAFLTALYFAVLPYNIYYSRIILPEPFMVFLTLGFIYLTLTWLSALKKTKYSLLTIKAKIKLVLQIILSLVFSISAILVKPYALFLFLPLFYLWIRYRGFTIKTILLFIIFTAISLSPFIWWRWWMNHYPEGIPANLWLLNGDGIRFKGAFFFWLFADRLVRLILGYWGIVLLVLGLITSRKKEGLLFDLWGVAVLLYLIVFATGNVRHDYYQIILIPIVVIYLAKGSVYLLDLGSTVMQKIKFMLILAVIFIFTEMFGWYHIRDYYNINHPEIVEAGLRVEKLTKDNALVIAPYNGDTAFLYQTRRAGWPVVQDSVEKLIGKGADYYVSVNFDDLTNNLIKQSTYIDPGKNLYKLIEMKENYVIIQLVPDSKLPK